MVAARATLVLAAAFVLAGAMFDSPSMYVPGIALALLVAGTRVWVAAAARRVRLKVQPGPWTINEGEPYPLELTIRSGGWPLPGGRVTHPLADRPARITGRSPTRVRVQLLLPRRGVGSWIRSPSSSRIRCACTPPSFGVSPPGRCSSCRGSSR